MSDELTDTELAILKTIMDFNNRGQLAHATELARATNVSLEVVEASITKFEKLELIRKPTN